MTRNPNKHSYPTAPLTQAALLMRTARIEAEAKYRHKIEDEVRVARQEFIRMLYEAHTKGKLGVSYLSQVTDYSRQALYEFIREAREMGIYDSINSAIPHSDIFSTTTDSDWFKFTLTKRTGGSFDGVEASGGTEFEAQVGRRKGKFQFVTIRNNTTGVNGISTARAERVANGTVLLPQFREWAAAMVPSLDTEDHDG